MLSSPTLGLGLGRRCHTSQRKEGHETTTKATRLFSCFRGTVDSDSSFWSQKYAAKGKEINKAKCHQCLPTYRHRPFVGSEVGTGSFGKYSAIHTTVLSSCSAHDVTPVAFPFHLERGKERKRRTGKRLETAALQRGHPVVNALHGSRLGRRQRRARLGCRLLQEPLGAAPTHYPPE